MNETRDPSVAHQLRASRDIDDLCDTFEKQLCQGEPPKLETYLDKVDLEHRPKLIRELLALTRHYLSESEMSLHLKDYLGRHPEHSNTIMDVLGEETLSVTAASVHSKHAGLNPKLGLQAGDTFGKFKVLEEVARGGMGVVFKAHQQDLDRVVALKVIISGHLATDDEIKRFKREARAVAALEHPNIVSIYEVDQVEQLHYFTMNYFEGVTLDAWTKMLPNDLGDEIRILIQLCEGINYAHERGIIHRDLKPANILVNQDGCVQIIDFGLAKEFDALRTAITGEQLIGTPLYMAPEQLLGNQTQFGPKSDIYTIGAILYELTTHQKPFAAKTLFELMQQVDSAEPARPTSLNSTLPFEIDDICRRCMAKDPSQRYTAAIEIADALRSLLLVPAAVKTRTTAKARPLKFPGTKTILGSLGLLFLMAGVFAILTHFSQGSKQVGPESARGIPNSADPTSLDAISQQLATQPRYFTPLNLSGQTLLDGVVPKDGKLSLYLKLELTTPSFNFLEESSEAYYPSSEEAMADPTIITPELDSLIRGHFDIPCKLLVTDSQGLVLETVEKIIVWDDSRGVFESETWNATTKVVDIRVIALLSDVEIDSIGKVSIAVEMDESVRYGSTIRIGELIAY